MSNFYTYLFPFFQTGRLEISFETRVGYISLFGCAWIYAQLWRKIFGGGVLFLRTC